MDEPKLKRERWYQKWWGVVVIAIASAIVIVGIIFLSITIKYWWQIKHGNGEVLFNKYGGFTHTINRPFVTDAIDRKTLESVTAHLLGNPNASTVMVEFLDFKCPNSKAAYPVIRRVAQKYGQKVKILIRHFPTESIHPGATQLAEISHCAYEQGNFWGMADTLFNEQDNLPANLTNEDITSLADRAGLNNNQLQECLRSGRAKTAVNRDYMDGFKFGVAGTPTFFVNGIKVEGAVPYEAWRKYFENVK